MTRKNYREFAKSFKFLKEIKDGGGRVEFEDVVIHIANDLKNDNARFDYDKFFKASGFNDKEIRRTI
jgi:hypothetical protein